ncbi:MAG: dTMP kinase, partial [Proteobacteria bacterium]|nr:dTMP kinase [Pseudomonadota bacterium]
MKLNKEKLFITFEGCDGSGKSTQANLLTETLRKEGYIVCLTKEPGGTELADAIRSLILNKEVKDAAVEFLLLSAARRDHMNNIILPALQKGMIVICDRFIDSSIVYQGIVKGLNINTIKQVHLDFMHNLYPDLTFLLDIKPQNAIKRLKKRGGELNCYDVKSFDFFSKI